MGTNPYVPANRLISADSRTRRGLTADLRRPPPLPLHSHGAVRVSDPFGPWTGRVQQHRGGGIVVEDVDDALDILAQSLGNGFERLALAVDFLGLALCFLAAPDERPDALGDPAL